MNVLEECVLLLCCRLGDKNSKPLTMTQFKELGLRVVGSLVGGNHLTELRPSHLRRLGYSEQEADHIIDLLDRQQLLQNYLAQAEQLGIRPITRVSEGYPSRITKKHAASRTPVLFAMGDLQLLHRPSIAVVGSRKPKPENAAFAANAGRLAAQEGYVLVSGGAAGIDCAAQDACLDAGGSCIVFVPDRLDSYTPQERILYLSADGYDIPFSASRALYRNTLIHAQAEKTLAAQCTHGRGGTWQGCNENLKRGLSDLFVFDDGSDAMNALIDLGATAVKELHSLSALCCAQRSLFDSL